MKTTLFAATLGAALLVESALAQGGGSVAKAGAGAGKTVTVPGELQPTMQADLKPQVRGRVGKVHVREGDLVKAGDLLVEINNDRVEDRTLLRILAPKDGTVIRVPVIAEQFIDETTTLVSVGNNSRLIIETRLNLADVARLAPKQDVKFTTEATGADTHMDAKILFVAPVATVKNGVKAFTVQAVIEKPDPRLRFGMPVQVSIPMQKPAK